jgi:hypothetical protein
MLQNNIVNIDEFIKLTNAGLKIATFTQVRAALIDRYKSIYGSDIDLSTGSADGIFVNDLALIINNLLQSMNIMYANLDVETASGVYLDTLCALSNVVRKPATKSNAYLNVTYTGSSQVTIPAQDLIFIDKSGLEWKVENDQTFTPNQTVSLQVFCSQEGVIQAPAGWIYQMIDASMPITVEQPIAANLGTEAESDGALRARRAQSSAAAGTTTLGSLTGALLGISGIKDVKIFNNNTSTDQTLSDGSTLDKHSIYVVVRVDEGKTIPDSSIGTLIYEKLTPGIHSCECLDSSATAKSYKYIAEVSDVHQEILDQYVYWKQASSIHPIITITITPYSFFSTDEFTLIANSIMSYANEQLLDTPLAANELLVQTIYADPMFKGKATYSVVSASAATHSNNIAYYKYTRFFVKCTGTVTGGSNTYAISNGAFTISDVSFSLCNNCVIDENSNIYPLTENNTFTYDDKEYMVSNIIYTKTGNNYVISIEG